MSVLKLMKTTNRVPFSHTNGIRTILPETPFVLELFHTAIRLYRLDEEAPIGELIFPKLGLCEGWTVFFDYEHRQVLIEGNSAVGFFRFSLNVSSDGIYFLTHKQPLTIAHASSVQILPIKKPFLISQLLKTSLESKPDSSTGVGIHQSRPFLSLGCNKDPLIERMRDRPIMEEIVPLLYHQAAGKKASLSTDTLLGKLVDAVEKSQRHEVLGLLRKFWTMALEGNCVPKRGDNLFFGYDISFVPDDILLKDALHIVSYAIRSMFIKEKSDGIHLLSCLPKDFVAGRLLEEVLEKGHQVSFEWRRGVVRRILLCAASDDDVLFLTGATSCSVRCCTLKNNKRDQNLSDRIAIKSGYRYLLDNFTV